MKSQCDEEIEPVRCADCNAFEDLHRLTFNTSWCTCEPHETCTHGICEDCLIEFRQQEDQKMEDLLQNCHNLE